MTGSVPTSEISSVLAVFDSRHIMLWRSYLVQSTFAQRTVEVFVKQKHMHDTLCTYVLVIASAKSKHLHAQCLSAATATEQLE